MHLTFNQKLHVPLLADHSEAVWSAKAETCSILLHKNYSCVDSILLNTSNQIQYLD